MKFLRLFLACALCFSAVHGFSLDRNAFTFTDYDLKVQIEPEQQRMGVRGRITLRNDSGFTQKAAVLQISSSLDWRSIRVNGEPVQFVSQTYTSDIDHTGALSEAIVNLPREVPPKASVELEIGYEGVILLDSTRLTRIGVPEDKAKHSDWDQIGPTLGAVRGIGYVAWYPIATDAASLSDANSVFDTAAKWKAQEQAARMRLNFCTSGPSAGFNVITNDRWAGVPGATFGGTNHGNGVLNCSEQIYDPVGFTVPTFAVAPSAQSDQGSASFYFLPAHQQMARAYMQASADVAGFVSDWFGAKSHMAKIAELPDRDAAPYESGTMLLAPAEGIDPKLARTLLVHELTHSTFHSPRPWIDEGLAHFAQAIWLDQESGRQAAMDFIGLHRTALAAAEKATGEQNNSKQSLITTSDEEYYRSKAMFVWWMLHDMVGDTAFKKAIAAYEPQHDMQPAYVQKLFETHSHRDLEWFFDDWVYRDRGLPDFRVVSAYSRQMLHGTYIVTVTVENLGTAGAEVPVRVLAEGGDVSSRVEIRGKATASVRIEVPSTAQEIIVNDGSVPESNIENNSFQMQEGKK